MRNVLCFGGMQFPQIPHYNLVEATEAAKKVMGPYYRCAEARYLFPSNVVLSLSSHAAAAVPSSRCRAQHRSMQHDFSDLLLGGHCRVL